MFLMSRHCFCLICQDIPFSIGESKFESESYINAILNKKGNFYCAHKVISGGVISGEMKLA